MKAINQELMASKEDINPSQMEILVINRQEPPQNRLRLQQLEAMLLNLKITNRIDDKNKISSNTASIHMAHRRTIRSTRILKREC